MYRKASGFYGNKDRDESYEGKDESFEGKLLSAIEEMIKNGFTDFDSIIEGAKQRFNDEDEDDEDEESPTAELLNLISISAGRLTVDEVKPFVLKGANINAITQVDTTPLLEVIMHGNDAVGEFLVRSGASYEFYEPEGRDSIIGNAITEDCRNTVKAIAEIDVSAKDEKGNTMLYLSILKARNEIGIDLISMGADVFEVISRKREKMSLLQLMFQLARKKMILHLIENNQKDNYPSFDINMVVPSGVSLIDCYGNFYLANADEDKIQKIQSEKQEIVENFMKRT